MREKDKESTRIQSERTKAKKFGREREREKEKEEWAYVCDFIWQETERASFLCACVRTQVIIVITKKERR